MTGGTARAHLINRTLAAAAQAAGIAAIYQEPTIFPDLNIAENVYMGHHICSKVTKRINWGKIYKETENLLESLEVDLKPRTKVRNLSAAQQQMVEIVKALSLKSKILIMDEPTSALTMREVKDLFKIIKRLKKSGTSIIYISHRIEEAIEVADRVTVLRDGHYIGTRKISKTTID